MGFNLADVRMLEEGDIKREPGQGSVDLTPYTELLGRVLNAGKVGAEFGVSEKDQRAEKRRLSTAAKLAGYEFAWRKSPPGKVRFIVAPKGAKLPGQRNRQPTTPLRSQPPAPATNGATKVGAKSTADAVAARA